MERFQSQKSIMIVAVPFLHSRCFILLHCHPIVHGGRSILLSDHHIPLGECFIVPCVNAILLYDWCLCHLIMSILVVLHCIMIVFRRILTCPIMLRLILTRGAPHSTVCE